METTKKNWPAIGTAIVLGAGLVVGGAVFAASASTTSPTRTATPSATSTPDDHGIDPTNSPSSIVPSPSPSTVPDDHGGLRPDGVSDDGPNDDGNHVDGEVHHQGGRDDANTTEDDNSGPGSNSSGHRSGH